MGSVTADIIKRYDGKEISIKFADGCALDVTICETLHLDEGSNFVGRVLRLGCDNPKHYHPKIGEYINIQLSDISTFQGLARENVGQKNQGQKVESEKSQEGPGENKGKP